MNCPKCGNVVSEKKSRCDLCAEDLTIYKKAYKASNLFYNKGLEKAKVRDLTGAITDLGNSLKLNKKNTDARNLLGLVYFEVGEVVDALSEWVLSKHFQPKENEADTYINAIQLNPTKLETLNQAIKKYNTALVAAQQGNEDLAIIQLKKVITINTNFIRAYHLLALIYIKNGEKDKARKLLIKVSRIDINNTTNLRYLREIGNNQGQSETSGGRQVLVNPMKDNPSVVPISTYKEEKPSLLAFFNLILGVVLGVAVVFILVVPTIKQNLIEEYNSKKVDYSDEMAVQSANIATLESDKKTLQEEVDDLKKKIGEYNTGELDVAQYDNLFMAITKYMDGELEEAANKLLTVKIDKIESKTARELYAKIQDETYKATALTLYEEGHRSYSAGRYEEAVTIFERSLSMDSTNENAIYFLGRSYDRLGNSEKAKEYYNEVVNNYPNSPRASEAKGKLRGIQ